MFATKASFVAGCSNSSDPQGSQSVSHLCITSQNLSRWLGLAPKEEGCFMLLRAIPFSGYACSRGRNLNPIPVGPNVSRFTSRSRRESAGERSRYEKRNENHHANLHIVRLPKYYSFVSKTSTLTNKVRTQGLNTAYALLTIPK